MFLSSTPNFLSKDADLYLVGKSVSNRSTFSNSEIVTHCQRNKYRKERKMLK